MSTKIKLGRIKNKAFLVPLHGNVEWDLYLELGEKTEIVLSKETDVVDVITEQS